MKLIKNLLTSGFYAALLLSAAVAQAQVLNLNYAGKPLKLLAPDGMVNATGEPAFATVGRAQTAPSGEFFAIFLPSADLQAEQQGKEPSFETYMVASGRKGHDTKPLTPGEFEKLKTTLLENLTNLSQSDADALAARIRERSAQSQRNAGLNTNEIRQGAPNMLGAFTYQEPQAFGVLVLIEFAADPAKQKPASSTLVAGASLYLNGGIFSGSFYQTYRSPADIERVKQQAQAWLTQMITNNQGN